MAEAYIDGVASRLACYFVSPTTKRLWNEPHSNCTGCAILCTSSIVLHCMRGNS